MSEQTIGKIDTFHIEEIVGDLNLPCDYAQYGEQHCPDEPAEWILHRVRCDCGLGGAVLACTHCKDLRLLGDGVVKCGDCGTYTPAREAYSYIEPLTRPY